MKLKKIAGMMLSCLMAGVIFAGCGDTEEKNSDIKLGMISNLNASEQQINEILSKVREKSDTKLSPHTVIYHNDLNSMLLGMDSKILQETSVYKSVANYLIRKNPKYQILENHTHNAKDSFCFAMLKTNSDIKSDFNSALKKIKNDGTLDKLVKKYITDLKSGEEPEAVEFQKFNGADTIKVAVTGDLPPFDLISSSGKPAGFNTALLAEIGKRLEKNIEIIDVDSAARAFALVSKQADVVFWTIIPVDNDRPSNIDMPDNIDHSDAYFTDEIVHIDLKK